MKKDTELIIQNLAQSFLGAFQAIISSDIGINKKSGKNTLQNSNMAKESSERWYDKNGDAVIELFVNDYIQYIESGRRKGAKFPPVEPIVRWCKKNNIPTDNSTVFLIRRAISRDGIPARPIFRYVWEHMDENMDKVYFDNIFKSIISEINQYFNS